jgi:hypothetical protein
MKKIDKDYGYGKKNQKKKKNSFFHIRFFYHTLK